MSTQTDVATAALGEPTLLTYREAINAAIADAMEADPSVIFMGEDVATAGGVFKTNEGLRERFGRERVLNTPICENGFLGVALGMSLMGLRPIAEIMFADFLPTAGDAIVNELPKYRFMSGGQCSVPVTVRVISGGTGRFGTQHSATGESWYIGQPGLRVAAVSSPGAAYAILQAAVRDNNPVLVHEHKGLYARKGMVQRGEAAEIGKAAIVREGRDVTILATLLMVERALQAAKTLAVEGIEAEVIDLRWLRPLDVRAVRSSVERTGRLVVAEEQVHAGGWGATIISELVMGGQSFKAPPRAVSMPADLLVPYSPPLEDEMIPSAESIAVAARAAMQG